MDDLIADLVRWIYGLEREHTQDDYALAGPSKG